MSVRKCRDTVASVRECTRNVGGVCIPRAVCVRHLRDVCTHPRSSMIQTTRTISTVCVRYFSSVWVCRHTARIKTRNRGRSGADCRFQLICLIRGQRVNPRPSVTVTLGVARCVRTPSTVHSSTLPTVSLHLLTNGKRRMETVCVRSLHDQTECLHTETVCVHKNCGNSRTWSGLRYVAHAHDTYSVCPMPTVYMHHLAESLRLIY